jgi:hypothetical protein
MCAFAVAQDRSTHATPPNASTAIYITHVAVIDTETGQEAQDRTVIISGDRISEVRDSKGLKAPAGKTVVDLRH